MSLDHGCLSSLNNKFEGFGETLQFVKVCLLPIIFPFSLHELSRLRRSQWFSIHMHNMREAPQARARHGKSRKQWRPLANTL
jgi:hypothetical protein